LRFGLAEDFTPIHKFPAVVGRPKNAAQVGEKVDDLEIKVSHRFAGCFLFILSNFVCFRLLPLKELIFCDEALKHESVFDVSRPIRNGIAENFDDLAFLLEHIFNSRKIKMNPQRAKLFLATSPLTSSEHREKIGKILFEKFSFHSIAFGNQAAMTLFGKGLTSGVVVNFDGSFTDICPVHYFPIKSLIKRTPSSDVSNLSQFIFDTVQAAEAKSRVDLFKRIFLFGDSNIDASSIENEIKDLYLTKVLNNSADELKKFKIRVEILPADNDTSFVGAALVARMNQDKPESWISRVDYQEKGAKVFE
jgi:actin-related protein